MNDAELLSHFQRHTDGIWTCVKCLKIQTPDGSIVVEEGTSFGAGVQYKGLNLAAELDAAAARCGLL
jgi:hypothetical protein